MSLLSSINRKEIIEKLESEPYDLIVVGGGITGAGIALDAASRGMKVALLEKDDFASGTSSKSTKLIHGGLRYLKQFEIGLVREVGRERAIVHKLAPHLVVAEKMLLPLVRGGTFGPLGTSVGLFVYDLLAGVRGDDKRRMLNKKQTLEKEPLLKGQSEALNGSGYYAEYRTDDARLTIENIKTAGKYGAVCLNYVKVTDLRYQDGKVAGVHCMDMETEEMLEVKAAYVVSAAGPWVDTLRKKDNSLKGKRIFMSKGVHIVVPHKRFPARQSLYFDIPDGRMAFAIPRQRVTYIGTTDTPYEGDPNKIPINQEDVDYLLNATNHMFPGVGLTSEDVESSWAGVRPLIYEEGKSASEMSRKDEIFESESGLISIAGGKLTGYRKMAERVTSLLGQKFQKEHNRTLQPSQTRQIPLSGGTFRNAEDVEIYKKTVAQQLNELGLDNYHADYLVANYGKQAGPILDKSRAYKDEPEVALARAEAWYAIHHELALHPMDFFNRRTGRLYFNLPSIPAVLEPILEDFQAYFQWSAERLKEETDKVHEEIRWVSEFEYTSKAGKQVSS
ncbi:MAG: glycerol-3-phosphate dehydrogenase/oxidase [Lewinellaceae bacterium]|nr:glycerol-3-phosphate dehydrogenase/oxidase [Phaeodactylibacter sp.]MCB0613888.1 glycerol-3-phosphate dehydrogenase/oxidase [Phaeodactylibacter sp.]MCB9349722.1 glycerol-3-phosphate dehydrogenase/oxidase [Lewinellaceae bacterium]